jgi:ATP-binding cassette, subfamily C (CFTR/MRP), member 1
MFRGGMTSLIYTKALELPAGLYDESAALTLMSADIDRIVTSWVDVSQIWARIIEIGIGIYLLERQLGWVCIAPIIVVIGKSVLATVRN